MMTLPALLKTKRILNRIWNFLNRMDINKPCSPNDKSNESINLWNKLPDEIVETILLNAIGSSTNAIQDYHSIIQTCSRF